MKMLTIAYARTMTQYTYLNHQKAEQAYDTISRNIAGGSEWCEIPLECGSATIRTKEILNCGIEHMEGTNELTLARQRWMTDLEEQMHRIQHGSGIGFAAPRTLPMGGGGGGGGN